MARIRSLHPGFAKDGEFVTISRDARLFFLLLLTQCDDQGAFVWKIPELKMELFPADNIDVPALLAELVSINAIQQYDHTGRKYGLVRNFRKFQRPKKPTAVHPVPHQWGTYVGLSEPSGELGEVKEGQVPPVGGKVSADVGCRVEEVEGVCVATAPQIPPKPPRRRGGEDSLGVVKEGELARPLADSEKFRKWLKDWGPGRLWPRDVLGPPPNERGCNVPAGLLREFGLAAAAKAA